MMEKGENTNDDDSACIPLLTASSSSFSSYPAADPPLVLPSSFSLFAPSFSSSSSSSYSTTVTPKVHFYDDTNSSTELKLESYKDRRLLKHKLPIKVGSTTSKFTVTKVEVADGEIRNVTRSNLSDFIEEEIDETSSSSPVVQRKKKNKCNGHLTLHRFQIKQNEEEAVYGQVLDRQTDDVSLENVIAPETLTSAVDQSELSSSGKLWKTSSGCKQSSIDGQKEDDLNKNQLLELTKRGRLFAKRKTFRLVYQTGECNIQYVNVDKRGARYLLDIFTTLVALKWRYNLIVYLVSFVLSWLLFACVWWVIHNIYGVGEDGIPCVEGLHSFLTAFLFSIETQHTIGYGSRYITDRCPPAVIVLMLQSVFGVVIQCIFTGIVFAKLSRPNRRAETVMFSKKAVICLESDGTLCLVFRVGDMRNSQLIGISINTVLVRKKRNREGRTIHLHQENLRTATEANDDGFYFLAWPLKIVHRIDRSSPLWDLSPDQLLVSSFEIVVVLEATCEQTGATIQVRTSYLPSEILWGHTLESLLTYQKDNGRYKVDYSQFDKVVPVDTPEMSAKDIDANRDRFKRIHQSPSVDFFDETLLNQIV